ncbi:hypothetical protein, partial [Stenotrophomonas maltophilia]
AGNAAPVAPGHARRYQPSSTHGVDRPQPGSAGRWPATPHRLRRAMRGATNPRPRVAWIYHSLVVPAAGRQT